MANIGFIQHRLGRTDGVSLEVAKIRVALERNGHRVHSCAGNEDVPGGQYIPELYPFHPVTRRILLNATRELRDDATPEALMADVRAHAERIKSGFVHFMRDNRLDLVFVHDLLSVGYNLAGMLALVEAIGETGVRTVCHDHDVWWEDSGEVYPACPEWSRSTRSTRRHRPRARRPVLPAGHPHPGPHGRGARDRRRRQLEPA